MRLCVVLALCFVCTLTSGFVVKLPAGSKETFYTNHIDGQFDLYELRLRYDLVEPASNHMITCQVHTPQRHLIHSARSSHSSMMHRPRETGLYELTFQNDMSVDVNVFFEFDAVFYGHRMYPGHAAADVSVHRSNAHVNQGEHHVLRAQSDEHIVFVRFDLDSIPSEYYLNEPNFWYSNINATLQLYVSDTDAPRGKAVCQFRHHYNDPIDPLTPGGLIAQAQAQRADYRKWKWNELEVNYNNRPINPRLLHATPSVGCKAGSRVEIDVSEIVQQALHAPHGSREITFEIASGDSHYVSFFSRNAPEEYKKPHLNIAMFPTAAMRSLLDLSQNVFIARADQVYTRMREREHRDTVESANATSFWLELLTWAIGIGAMISQFMMMSSYVNKK